MKNLLIILCFVFTFKVSADCRPVIERDLVKRISKLERVDHIGKVTTGSAFLVVGGFYGVMGVYLLGPLWAGAIVGATFGTVAAIPVGTIFVVHHQVQKKIIASRGKALSIINQGEELDTLLEKILNKRPDLSREVILNELDTLNKTNSLCDGTVSRANRLIPTKKIIATPKDIQRWFTHFAPEQNLLN
jgi:hypothetical protein